MNQTRPQHIRGPWGRASEIERGLWRVRLESKYSSLAVNSYILVSPNALVVVDPGWPWTLDELGQALAACGIAQDLGEVTCWVYTHAHVDHMGAASIIAQRWPQAPHVAHAGLAEHHARWHTFQDEMGDWRGWVQGRLVDPARTQLTQEIDARRRPTMLMTYGEGVLGDVQGVRAGDVVSLGDFSAHVLEVPGHDPFHIALWIESTGWLITGDVILPVPTPITPHMGDELQAYTTSLDTLEVHIQAQPPSWLLPGHGTPVIGVRAPAALARSRGFVHARRANILKVLEDAPAPMGIHALTCAQTPEGVRTKPSTQWWVMMTSTDAHLRWLIEYDDVVRVDSPDGPLFWI